eukprot:2833649-Prymnesium_polylepis.1
MVQLNSVQVEGTQRPPFPANDKGTASLEASGALALVKSARVAGAEPDRRREWHGDGPSPCHSP